MPARPRISVFPKCYFDEIYYRRMSYLDWLRQAATLGAEGVEHYDGFFRSLDPAGVGPVRRALAETGQVSSMLCFSPDFTHPDACERRRQVERQRAAIDLCVTLGMRHCRTLSGQRCPLRVRQCLMPRRTHRSTAAFCRPTWRALSAASGWVKSGEKQSSDETCPVSASTRRAGSTPASSRLSKKPS